MGFLVRKFTRSKWGDPVPADHHTLKADAVTSCLRTSGDTLSVWRIADDTEIETGIMAIVGTLETIQGFHYLVLEEDAVLALGLNINESAGGSFVTELNGRHADIVNLTYDKIGLVADEMRRKISLEEYDQITASKVKKRIKEAIENGTVKVEDLSDKLLRDLKL